MDGWLHDGQALAQDAVLGAAGAIGPMQVWVLPALLGLGLAAATGLRAFLPLLLLALAARLGLFGVQLNDQMAWLGSNGAIAALAVAALVEVMADKVPVVDNALQAVGVVVRPLAAAVAAGSVFWALDPTAAAVAGLIVGAPTALAFAGASGGTRAASTVTTGGLANPLLSVLEDAGAVLMVLLAFLAPILVPVALVVALVLIVRLARAARRRRRAAVETAT